MKTLLFFKIFKKTRAAVITLVIRRRLAGAAPFGVKIEKVTQVTKVTNGYGDFVGN